jgi:hypothetical protein
MRFQLALLAIFLVASMAQQPVVWFVLSMTASIALFRQADLADNHKYLLCYWLWVMCIAHIPRD